MTPLEHNKHLKDLIPYRLLIKTKHETDILRDIIFHHVLFRETGVWSIEIIFSDMKPSSYSFEEEPIIEIQSYAGGHP